MDSFDEIARQDIEEGKTSSVSDFIIRSPNIQKKKMNFGQHVNMEFVWMKKGNDKEKEPILIETFKDHSVLISKCLYKWSRLFLLDHGKKFQSLIILPKFW